MFYWRLVRLSCHCVQGWSTVIGEIIWLCQTLVTLAALVYFLYWINEQWRTFVNYMSQPRPLSQKDRTMRTVKTREARLTEAPLLGGEWPVTATNAKSRYISACKDQSTCCLHGRPFSVFSDDDVTAFCHHSFTDNQRAVNTEGSSNVVKITTIYKEEYLHLQEFPRDSKPGITPTHHLKTCGTDACLTDDEKSEVKRFSTEKRSQIMPLKTQLSVLEGTNTQTLFSPSLLLYRNGKETKNLNGKIAQLFQRSDIQRKRLR